MFKHSPELVRRNRFIRPGHYAIPTMNKHTWSQNP